MAYLLPTSLILPHLHTLYIDVFSIVLLTVFLVIPCVPLCCCLCRTAFLYLGQVAVVSENLFTTSQLTIYRTVKKRFHIAPIRICYGYKPKTLICHYIEPFVFSVQPYQWEK
jgi:hypothetical protein